MGSMSRARFARTLGLLALVAVLAACGGSADASGEPEATSAADAPSALEQPESSETTPVAPAAEEQREPTEAESADQPSTPTDGQTLQDLLDAEPGDDVSIVWGTGDLEPGELRLSFLIVDDQGELTQAPNAELVVGKIELEGESEVDATLIPAVPAATSSARLESVDAVPHEHEGDPLASHDHIDATDLYVAHVELSEPGLYWAVATPREEGLEASGIQAFGTFEVREEAIAPTVGDRAFASDTPTLDDAPAAELTTLDPPAEELLRHSIADSLADGAPFVVTFATPAFCQTRVCGPVVETVDGIRADYEANGIRFIQVEIYNDNDPNAGVNEWVQEWGLPSEPWTFIVDADGVIQERFEGAMSPSELADAIERTLL